MAAAVGRQPGLSWLDEVAMCGAKQRELGRWRRSDGSGSCHGWTSSLPSHGLAAANPHRPPPSSLCTLLSFPFLF
jgi:hypothetical protein